MRRGLYFVLAIALITGAAACTAHTDKRSRDDADKAAQEAKESAREAAEEAKAAGREAAAEGKAAADEARQQAEEARREAEDARRDAMAEAHDQRDGDAGQHQDSNGEVVNLNSASAQQIANATGLTAPMVQKIVASRPYTSKRDLVSKKIVDEQTYWKIQKHVTVMSK